MVLLYALTLFASALLLFLVQPMVGKMTLPMLGGTPAVWNTCMVFFQAVLLVGYAYAHATTRLLGVRKQAALHLAVLSLPFALMALPIGVPEGLVPPTEGNPTGWLLVRLAVWVGLPFFVVSTSAPLLQKWFSGTGHHSAKDPYFLYAASNAGSLLALVAYPLVVERFLDVSSQSRWWMFGYGGLVALIVLCALAVWLSKRSSDDGTVSNPQSAIRNPQSPAGQPVTTGRRLWWVVLSLIPSSLMLGATTHITTNVAPVPLLWVVPLALYLLTFIMVFGRRRIIPYRVWVALLPFLITPAAVLSISQMHLGPITVLLHLLGMFAVAVVCHGELANDRPATSHLTEYFLWMSLGGVLGGLLNAVVAPLVFNSIAEYPLVIVLGCLVLARGRFGKGAPAEKIIDIAAPIVLTVATGGLAWFLHFRHADAVYTQATFFNVMMVPTLLVVFLGAFNRPLRFGLALAGLLAVGSYLTTSGEGRVLYAGRNFFGVKRIVEEGSGTGSAHVFYHGNTNHGFQQRNPQFSHLPMAYFHRKGPIGDVFPLFCENAPRVSHVAVVGLAAGSMAAYATPGQHFTFYEIDPDVAKIAENPAYFTYLPQCKAEYDIVIGDGRLTLGAAPDGHYGLIVLDAFSSDAVPTHLLTREAVRLYVSKLAEGGALVFNVSNNYLDLAGLLGNVATAEGLVAFHRADVVLTDEEKAEGRLESQYVVMARKPRDLRGLPNRPHWVELHRDPSLPTWTDQFSNIAKVFKSQIRFTTPRSGAK